MQVKYSEAFHKSVKKIKDNIALKRLDVVIEKLKQANCLDEISNVTYLVHIPFHYRIRIGDYRLIVEEKERGGIEILLIEYLKRNEKTYQKYK